MKTLDCFFTRILSTVFFIVSYVWLPQSALAQHGYGSCKTPKNTHDIAEILWERCSLTYTQLETLKQVITQEDELDGPRYINRTFHFKDQQVAHQIMFNGSLGDHINGNGRTCWIEDLFTIDCPRF